ncbi:MAG: ATPase, T2SS/T4P/T4SS family [Sumerlaeia bacterium]
MIRATTKELGLILSEKGLVDPNDLDAAVRDSHKTGLRLGETLIKMGFVEEEQIMMAVAEQVGAPFRKLTGFQPDPQVLDMVPVRVASHYNVLPLEYDEDMGVLHVAIVDPLDFHVLDELRRLLGLEVEPVVCLREEIEKARNRAYGVGGDTIRDMEDERLEEGDDGEDGIIGGDFEIDEEAGHEDASIVKFVNQVVKEAFRDRATDIHVEPFERELRVRYRIDGVLYEAPIPPAIKRYQQAIISRIKIMSDLNIAERRLPQDGKIKLKMQGKEFDLRVSTVPTPYGESCAIRILSRDSELCTLDRLGFSEYHKGLMREMIQKPHGVIFITGPTGSGKSTTLYASLTEINTPERKIITVEDPIEYRIPGVTQIQVNPGIDLTFARILRTLLRQDPDVIMVGETRDPETARATIANAMTGHLVFSTLHTNDACSAVTRLEDMGIEPFLVASSVEGMVAQRLVRVLCTECKTPYKPDPRMVAQVNMTRANPDDIEFFRPVGCEACRYTGFKGRTAVHEMVKMNEGLRRQVVAGSSASEIKREALLHGFKPIRYDGWNKIKEGHTTIEEVLRVTMEDELSGEEMAEAIGMSEAESGGKE